MRVIAAVAVAVLVVCALLVVHAATTKPAPPVLYPPVVDSQLTILTLSCPNATLGSPYNFSLLAAGGTPPYSWALQPLNDDGTISSLPPGMSLSSLGLMSGTPTATGTWKFTFTVTDSSGKIMKSLPLNFRAPYLLEQARR